MAKLQVSWPHIYLLPFFFFLVIKWEGRKRNYYHFPVLFIFRNFIEDFAIMFLRSKVLLEQCEMGDERELCGDGHRHSISWSSLIVFLISLLHLGIPCIYWFMFTVNQSSHGRCRVLWPILADMMADLLWNSIFLAVTGNREMRKRRW